EDRGWIEAAASSPNPQAAWPPLELGLIVNAKEPGIFQNTPFPQALQNLSHILAKLGLRRAGENLFEGTNRLGPRFLCAFFEVLRIDVIPHRAARSRAHRPP